MEHEKISSIAKDDGNVHLFMYPSELTPNVAREITDVVLCASCFSKSTSERKGCSNLLS